MAASRARQHFLTKVAAGSEDAALSAALNRADAGGWVIYHSGNVGTAPRSMIKAASDAELDGRCLLVQRVNEDRVVDYIAVKVVRNGGV